MFVKVKGKLATKKKDKMSVQGDLTTEKDKMSVKGELSGQAPPWARPASAAPAARPVPPRPPRPRPSSAPARVEAIPAVGMTAVEGELPALLRAVAAAMEQMRKASER
jgi:hypothetical protein